MIRSPFIASVAAALLLSACAPQKPGTQTPEQRAAAQKRAGETFLGVSQGDAQVKTFFDGPGGLIGLVIESPDGKQNIAWATPDGSHIILGAVVDRDGLNHTGRFAAQLHLDPGPQTNLRNIDNSVTVDVAEIDGLKNLVVETVGEGARDVYVIIDPMCPHCRNSYQAMQNQAYQKGLKVHWIVTATVGGDFSAQMIEKFRAKSMTLKDMMTTPGAPPEARPIDSGAMTYISQGVSVLDEVVRQRAVPAVIYKSGDTWRAKTGFNPAEYLSTG